MCWFLVVCLVFFYVFCLFLYDLVLYQEKMEIWIEGVHYVCVNLKLAVWRFLWFFCIQNTIPTYLNNIQCWYNTLQPTLITFKNACFQYSNHDIFLELVIVSPNFQYLHTTQHMWVNSSDEEKTHEIVFSKFVPRQVENSSRRGGACFTLSN